MFSTSTILNVNVDELIEYYVIQLLSQSYFNSLEMIKKSNSFFKIVNNLLFMSLDPQKIQKYLTEALERVAEKKINNSSQIPYRYEIKSEFRNKYDIFCTETINMNIHETKIISEISFIENINKYSPKTIEYYNYLQIFSKDILKYIFGSLSVNLFYNFNISYQLLYAITKHIYNNPAVRANFFLNSDAIKSWKELKNPYINAFLKQISIEVEEAEDISINNKKQKRINKVLSNMSKKLKSFSTSSEYSEMNIIEQQSSDFSSSSHKVGTDSILEVDTGPIFFINSLNSSPKLGSTFQSVKNIPKFPEAIIVKSNSKIFKPNCSICHLDATPNENPKALTVYPLLIQKYYDCKCGENKLIFIFCDHLYHFTCFTHSQNTHKELFNMISEFEKFERRYIVW